MDTDILIFTNGASLAPKHLLEGSAGQVGAWVLGPRGHGPPVGLRARAGGPCLFGQGAQKKPFWGRSPSWWPWAQSLALRLHASGSLPPSGPQSPGLENGHINRSRQRPREYGADSAFTGADLSRPASGLLPDAASVLLAGTGDQAPGDDSPPTPPSSPHPCCCCCCCGLVITGAPCKEADGLSSLACYSGDRQLATRKGTQQPLSPGELPRALP